MFLQNLLVLIKLFRILRINVISFLFRCSLSRFTLSLVTHEMINIWNVNHVYFKTLVDTLTRALTSVGNMWICRNVCFVVCNTSISDVSHGKYFEKPPYLSADSCKSYPRFHCRYLQCLRYRYLPTEWQVAHCIY